MENNFYTPAEIMDHTINAGITKANLPTGKMILLGIIAGAFIAIGGAASNVAIHSISNVGLARTLAGTIFPVGLMLILLIGGELFTGNCLMLMAFLDKKITLSSLLQNLIIVYFSNLIGALIIDTLIFFSGQLDYSAGALGAYTIKTALTKITISPVNALTSGILCNILVCLAILMANAAKDISGKILGIFFPICTFVICGFEHCIANMFYIPIGMMAASHPDYVTKAKQLYGIPAIQCKELISIAGTKNFLFVTIGNILGGMLFVGVVFYAIHKRKWKSHSNTPL